MNHLTKFFVLLMLVGIELVIPSCKKSDPAPPDPAKILEGNSWRGTALTVTPALYGETDLYAFYEPCEKDDFLKFNASNILIHDNGATKCDASDPQTTPGTWSYNNSSKILHINLSDGNITVDKDYILKEINDNSFKTELSIPDNGVTYAYTFTYQKL